MTIDSNKVTVNASPEQIMNFLKDATNLVHLLPGDKISDFKSTAEECSFKVQGGFIISLIEDGQEGNNQLFLKSGKGTPFAFKLTVNVKDVEGKSEGYLHFDGEVNMFLKMMVEKPLTNLFNYMSDRLATYFNEEK